jgi:tetratricopeptide (TPR) repeat protein
MWGCLALAWTGQLIYYGVVGYRTASWDYDFTRAEKSRFGPHPSDPKHADRYYREALVKADQLDVSDGRLARTYHDLGTVLWQDGRLAAAAANFERALAVFRLCDGPQSLMVGVCQARLGDIALAQNRLDVANHTLPSANAIFVRVDAPQALRVRNQANLARLWCEQGRFREANGLLRSIVPSVMTNPQVGDLTFRQSVQFLDARVQRSLRAQR